MKENKNSFKTSIIEYSRKDFLKNAFFGSTALFMFGNLGILRLYADSEKKASSYSMIVVDYKKCTGCRTCEAVCSAYNHKVRVNDEILPGLGNPHYSNIRVYNYNPDMDIPVTCALCTDNPCIEACPVEPDEKTGNRALYRDKKTGAIKNDLKRCIGCGNCASKCTEKAISMVRVANVKPPKKRDLGIVGMGR